MADGRSLCLVRRMAVVPQVGRSVGHGDGGNGALVILYSFIPVDRYPSDTRGTSERKEQHIRQGRGGNGRWLSERILDCRFVAHVVLKKMTWETRPSKPGTFPLNNKQQTKVLDHQRGQVYAEIKNNFTNEQIVCSFELKFMYPRREAFEQQLPLARIASELLSAPRAPPWRSPGPPA